MFSKFLTTIAVTVLAQCAMAADMSVEKHFPQSIALGQTSIHLNGIGIHEFLFMDIYQAGLYLPKKESTTEAILAGNSPIRARLYMLGSVSASHFVLVLRDGLVANTTQSEVDSRYKEILHFFDMMEKLGHLDEGTLVDLDFVNGQTSIRLNGKPFVSHLGDRVFYNLILKIWLGDEPISKDVKKGLLPQK